MTNEEKGRIYAQLMFEHTKTQNKIASIKGESIDLNPQQKNEIKLFIITDGGMATIPASIVLLKKTLRLLF